MGAAAARRHNTAMTRTALTSLAVAATLAATASPPSAAAPGNDDFEHAAALGGAPAHLAGSVDEATRQTDEPASGVQTVWRSEEHTSELQSRQYIVRRLLLAKKDVAE